MMVEELTRQKDEAEERRVLLKNVRMELMTKVEQIELKVTEKTTTPSNGVDWVNVSILKNPVKYGTWSSLSHSWR